ARTSGHKVADVALEARLARRDLLEQRCLAGVAERTARALVLFEHRDVVALGRQRRIGQAGGSGADDGDALPPPPAPIRKQRLAASGAGDHATDPRPAAPFAS